MQTLVVDEFYSPIASDVFINGVLHDVDGVMYCAQGTPTGTRQFINGILHTEEGVRYIAPPPAVNDYPEGFSTDANGAMIVTDSFDPPINYTRGIALSTGAVFVSDSGSGSPLDNRLLDDTNLDEYLLDDTNTDDVYLLDGAPFFIFKNADQYVLNQDSSGPLGLIFRYDMRWKPDGTRVFFFHGGTSHPSFDDTYQYDATIPWSFVGGLTPAGSVQIGSDTLNRSISWVNNGTRLVKLARWFSSFRRLDSFPASTPYDLTTLGAADQSFTGLIGGEFGQLWSDDWTQVLISRSSGEWNRYNAAVPGDITTLSGPDQTWDAFALDGVASSSLAISPDGTKLYGINTSGGRNIVSWDLAAPFSISPAPSNFNVGPNMNLPTNGDVWRGLSINPNTGELLAAGDQNAYRLRSWTA